MIAPISNGNPLPHPPFELCSTYFASRRLRCGHYVVKARWPDRQLIGDEPLGPGGHPIGGLGGGGSSLLERGVWLFPEEPGVGCVTDVTKVSCVVRCRKVMCSTYL